MFRFTPEMASRLRFIKPNDAARVYGVHTNTIYNKVKNNTIAYIRIDGSVRVAVWTDEYEQWLEEQHEDRSIKDDDDDDEEDEDEEDSPSDES